MHIYNNQKNHHPFHHILDPDYHYQTSLNEEHLYPFFKHLVIPQDVTILIGLYIEYHISPFHFEKYPLLYQKVSPYVEKLIVKYFDFGEANLYSESPPMFFITMFDSQTDDIQHAFFKLRQQLTQKDFIYKNHICTFDVKCGVYFSHTYIHPFEFFQCTQQQFKNTLKDKESLISIKPLFI